MKKAIKLFLPTAEAIQRLLHPHAEVVVHDIKLNQIVAIYHPFSKRRVGNSSLFTKDEEMARLDDCIGPYEKINEYIHAYLFERRLSLKSLHRSEKKELIEHLNKIGAFTAKNAALYIAEIIGVSRATIYNYLAG